MITLSELPFPLNDAIFQKWDIHELTKTDAKIQLITLSVITGLAKRG
jgi:hypothetical protein